MTADELITNTRPRAGLQTTSLNLTPTQILASLNEDMWSYVVPALIATNGEFFTASKDVAITANQSAYALPARVVAGALRAIKFVDANGIEGTPLATIEIPDTGRYNITTANAPIGYFQTATDVNLLPLPNTTAGSLRMYYHLRPGALVQDSLNGSSQHTAIVTIASVTPTVITTSGIIAGQFANTLIDIVSHNSPHKLLGMDLATTTANAGSSSITTPGIDLTLMGITAGDTVTLAQTSWYPQGIPLEWHTLLELVTAARLMGIIGDLAGQQEILRQEEQRRFWLNSVTEPRNPGNPKKLNAWR